jgi:hypothetical protein
MATEAPDGSIVITPKEFYDGVRSDIADIKNAVAPLSELRGDVDDLKAGHRRLGERVGNLEARYKWAAGFSAAAGLAAGWLIPHFIK